MEEDFVRFPFKFELGASLPASVVYAGPKDSVITIKYMLTASLVPHLGSDMDAVSAKQALVIKQLKLKTESIRAIQECAQNIKCSSCILFSSGTSTLRTQLDNDMYFPSEQVTVNCEVDNSRCRKGVDSLKVVIQQRIRIHISADECIDIHEPVFTQTFDGVAARSSTNGLTKTLTMDLSQFSHKVSHKCALEGDEFITAERLQPTVDSKFCEIEYSISVEAIISGGCHTNPSTSHSLILIPSP